jgi:alcohol dehydrogenase class IV
MKEFEYFMPVRLVFGRGKVSEAGALAARYGTKVMVVTGRSSTKKTGLLDKVITILKKEGLECLVFDKVEENPLTVLAAEGASEAIEAGCDVVLGLGGGSALDAAKAIAFMAVNEGSVSEYIYGRQGLGALPVIAIPTTAGTGSEADSLAMLTNPETKDKKSLKSPYIYPKAAVIDPELMATLPRHLVAATGFDALCHNIEAFAARRSNLISNQLAIKGIEIISTNLPRVYENPDDIEAWGNMALASTFGGMAIDAAGVALAHGLEHSVSGLLNVRHGEGLAAILVPFMEYSCQSACGKFAQIASALGEDVTGLSEAEAALGSIEGVKKLMRKIDLKFRLSDLGVRQEHIEWLAHNSMKTMAYAICNNPKVPDAEGLKTLYRLCL